MVREQGPTVLILASGRGERFRDSGGQGSKLQALLNGKTVLQHTLDAVHASGLPFYIERGPHAGMGDSIAAAVRATRESAGWLILPGDLPLVQPATLQAVAQALAQHAVVRPVYDGQRGHPVGFAALCGAELQNLKGNQGAALVVKARGAMNLMVNDAGTVTDIDTLDDLARVAAVLAQHAPPAVNAASGASYF